MCVCVQGEGSDADEEVHSEELVMPGSLRELAEFEQHATSLARCSVSCTLPSVHIHLPNKSFLETLYNRWVGGFNWSMSNRWGALIGVWAGTTCMNNQRTTSPL